MTAAWRAATAPRWMIAGEWRAHPVRIATAVIAIAIGVGLGVAVRLVPGEAPFPGSVGDWWWSGVGGTYFWVDPTEGFFAIFMMQTSSAEQRQHYRTLARAMIYAALENSSF